tara:strand:+ start:931 stop:1866 length:936 start_codon:yes stop_codon:yes gene_type:complete
MPKLLSMGECMIELFSEDSIEEAQTFHKSLAGDSFNIAVAVSRLGSSVGYITKLGNDPFEKFIRNSFEKEKIDMSLTLSSEGFNAVHFVATMPDGNRDFVYYRKGSSPSNITPNDLDESYIKNAKIMHCSGITQAISESSRETVMHAAKIAHSNNIMVSYDPNYRHQLWSPKEAISAMEEIMPYVDIFLPSAPEDTMALFNTDDPEQIISISRKFGVSNTLITMGSKGALVDSKGKTFSIPPYQSSSVVDTTGAGDAFKGGFLHGILENLDIKKAAEIGNIAAGITITGRGAINSIPYKNEVYEILNNMGV